MIGPRFADASHTSHRTCGALDRLVRPEVQNGYAPLGDFFPAQASLGLVPITLVNNSFDLSYFANFDGPFEDPDDDMIDPQD